MYKNQIQFNMLFISQLQFGMAGRSIQRQTGQS